MTQFVDFDTAAARVTAAGLPTARRAVEHWTQRHPGLKIKIGGRCGIRGDALDLLIAGVPIREVNARMRAAAHLQSQNERGAETRGAA